MTAPNIEMIASSLRNCSLTGAGGGRRRRRSRAEGSDDSDGVTVELNSQVALPYHWEQCLDIRTGQVYYINWEDGSRTTVDPRTFTSSRSTSSTSRRSRASTCSSGYGSVSSMATAWRSSANDGSVSSLATAWRSSGNDGVAYGYDGSYGADKESNSSASISSTLSSFSPTDDSASSGTGNGNGASHVLVAAGCRACFMYFMVPKSAGMCPKCGSFGLLHLGSSNGYA